jgi:hypothetical protein
MKLLQGAKGGVVDDTVASQAEVEALSEKVQQLDNLVGGSEVRCGVQGLSPACCSAMLHITTKLPSSGGQYISGVVTKVVHSMYIQPPEGLK